MPYQISIFLWKFEFEDKNDIYGLLQSVINRLSKNEAIHDEILSGIKIGKTSFVYIVDKDNHDKKYRDMWDKLKWQCFGLNKKIEGTIQSGVLKDFKCRLTYTSIAPANRDPPIKVVITPPL